MISAILLSGGIDSSALAWWMRPDVAITIDYGQQPAEAEKQASAQVCAALGLRHEVLTVNCRALGSGDLAGTGHLSVAPSSEWWPYRNQLLITLAAGRAIQLGGSELLIGAVRSDSSHVDGRPGFFDAIDALLRMQEGAIRVSAPAITMSSAELVKVSQIPLEVLAWCHSCHVANLACGLCRGCCKHWEVTKELGIEPY